MTRQWKSKTLGVSKPHEQQLLEIKEHLQFGQEDDTYKFCVSYALANKLTRNTERNIKRETKWAMGNFDADGDLLVLLNAMFPEEEDVQSVLMTLAEAGIEAIHKKVTEEYLYTIGEVLKN
jgi:hypothetical protein